MQYKRSVVVPSLFIVTMLHYFRSPRYKAGQDETGKEQRVKQVNKLFKIKKTQLCWWFKSTYLWIQQFRNTHGWNKSTYFSKWRKHNHVGDSSQHTLAYCSGWNKSTYFSQHTFQNQVNTTVVVIQVSIL